MSSLPREAQPHFGRVLKFVREREDTAERNRIAAGFLIALSHQAKNSPSPKKVQAILDGLAWFGEEFLK